MTEINGQDYNKALEDARSLNSDVFSLTRLEILYCLDLVRQDGLFFRDLKNALQANDGLLYSNLEALKKTGYIASKIVESEGQKMTLYNITQDGSAEWTLVKDFLRKIAQGEKI